MAHASRQWLMGRTVEHCAIALAAVALCVTPVQALGPADPPRITFAAVWVNTFSTNAFVSAEEGTPQLYVDVDVEIPGGDVPTNVQSVTVTLPDGMTQFQVSKASDDLFVENEYFLNLTQAGVTGFPTGSYTFTVTDTAGGVTAATDTLTDESSLMATAFVAVTDAVQVSSRPGEHFSLNLTVSPTPTVTWAPVAGAARYRLRIRPLSGPDVFVHTQTGTTSTLPAGVLVPGRLYRVVVEAETSAEGLPPSNARSRREIRVITRGPELTLSGSGATGPGQTFTVSARVVNTGPPVTVNARGWLGRPDGSVITIFSVDNATLPDSTGLPNNDLFNGPVFSMAFSGAEQNGNYVVGVRLTDPATGETIAQSSLRFQR